MRNLIWLVAALTTGCAVEEASTPLAASGEGYVIEGDLPAGVELEEVLARLPEGGFAVVADPGTGETATLTSTSSPYARVASGEFSVAVAASCTDCGDPTCASTSRTIAIGLSHDSGIDGETYSIQTVDSTNFSAPVTTPDSFAADVGDVVNISTTGTLPTCAPFAHYFDVIGPDAAPAWSHTISVDGNLGDWLTTERFDTSQGAGTDTYVTWDADTLFVGVRHPDVTTGGPQHWVVVTVGNGAGPSTVGATIGTQTPSLPFGATRILRWKADGSYADVLSWNGSDWSVVGAPSVAEDNGAGTVEFAVSLAAAGVVDHADVHVNFVYEGAGFESSYAATPAGSFAQGAYDPDYGQYLSFDLSSADAPADQ